MEKTTPSSKKVAITLDLTENQTAKNKLLETYAIKRLPKKDGEGYWWAVFKVEIYENSKGNEKVVISLEKDQLSKAEAIAYFQRTIAANVIFGKNQ